MARGQRQRRHKPSELGPRVFRTGRWWRCDLRPWSAGRPTLRNPEAPGWPARGERTEDEEIARRWAWAYLDLARGEHRRRVLKLPRDRTVKDAVREFLEHRKAVVERATWSADRTAVNHLSEALGRKRVATVEPEEIQTLMDSLLHRGYKATTCATYLKTAGVFFRWAGYDATAGVYLPDRGRTDVVTLEAHEVAQLLEAARKVDRQQVGHFPSALLSVQIGLTMGLRQGEIFALRWENVSASERAVRVNWQIPKESTVPKPLKGKLARTALVLPEWWAYHRPDAIGYIVGRNGRPVGTRTQRNLITRVLDTAGVNGVGRGWHLLRHTYSDVFLKRGGTIGELRLSLGHSSTRTTERVYDHMAPDFAVTMAAARIYGT